MTNSAHLWAVGYEDMNQAQHAREAVVALADTQKYIRLLDIAILMRSADGSLTFNGKPFSATHHLLGHGTLGLLAGFALAVPVLSDEAVSRLVDAVAPNASSSVGIDQSFKQEIASMIRPGTSTLLVLDITENPSAVLGPLQGLGGTVLKTNVDIERANLIQSTLARKLNP